MADSTVRHKVEAWIRERHLPKVFGKKFEKQRVQLQSGQVREIDAVSLDGAIHVEIATSAWRTASGNPGTGGQRKVKNDVRDLALVPTGQRVLCVTDPEMAEWAERQKLRKNFPPDLVVIAVALPKSLRVELDAAQRLASDEMR